MNGRAHGAMAWLTMAACAAFGAAAEPRGALLAAERIVLVEAGARSGVVVGLNEQSVQFADGSSLPLADVRAIEARSIRRPARPACVVHLADGSVASVERMTTVEDACQVTWRGAEEWRLPLDALRAVRFSAIGGAEADAAFAAALADREAADDRLLALTQRQVQTVRGALEACGDEEVRFVCADAPDEEPLTLPLARVAGLVLAQSPAEPAAAAPIQVRLVDGSQLMCRGAGLDGGALRMALFAGPSATVPWADVAQISFQHARVRYLSDMQPSEVVESPLVTFARRHQRDRNVLGGPLALSPAGAEKNLAGREFEKGLGVHAASKLVYGLPSHARLLATLGIDRASRGGDCLFVVSADDAELFRQRIRQGDPPVELRIDLAGRRSLALIVEAGEQLDLGDLADWCDARLVLDAAE